MILEVREAVYEDGSYSLPRTESPVSLAVPSAYSWASRGADVDAVGGGLSAEGMFVPELVRAVIVA